MSYKQLSPIIVSEGGTGSKTFTAYSLIAGGTTATGAFQNVVGVGTSGQILVSAGAGALPAWTTAGGTTILNSLGGNTGTATPTAGKIDIKTSNSTLTFVGAASAVTLSMTGTNICFGSTLPALAGGANNITFGTVIGNTITSGSDNFLAGSGCGANITSSSNNQAIGNGALNSVTNSTGNNVAIGKDALGVFNGSNCIAIGNAAGGSLSGTEANNILIGSTGTNGDGGRIRIGTNATHTSCFIQGIQGVNAGSTATVVTSVSNQQGTAVITAGAGISVATGANTITIAATGAGFTWALTTVDASIVVENGYIANKAGLLTMTLPSTAAIGDVFIITNINTAVGFRIAQNALQQIRIGTSTTTIGVTGYLEATALGDTVECVCTTAGTSTRWQVIDVIGNITVV